MSCPHSKIADALDRFEEAHWHIHQIEKNYHYPRAFRYSVNSFIRSLKEVPTLLRKNLQNRLNFKSEIQPIINGLKENALFSLLHTKRNFIVHQGTLELHSEGFAGVTYGRNLKLGGSFPIAPFESSDEGYERFKLYCKSNPKILFLLGPQDDQRPCIERYWRIDQNEEMDLLDLSTTAWRAVGNVISAILILDGADRLDLSLECCGENKITRLKIYNSEGFWAEVSDGRWRSYIDFKKEIKE